MGSTSGRGGGRDGFFSHWWRGLFPENDSARAGRRKRKGDGLQTRRLRFESCEDRRMLSIGVNFAGGVLTLTGTDDTDQVSVVGRTSYLDVYVDGNFQARILNANSNNVNSIVFDGGDGDDSLAVQYVRPSTLAIDLTDVETLSVIKSRSVTVTANAALNLGTSSITGTLSLTANGELTQTGQVLIASTTTLDVGANDITLTNAANNFATVILGAPAQNVSLRDVNAIVLGNMSVNGDLSVEANLNSTSRTAIYQSGGAALAVGGSTTLSVGPASTITLNNSGNQFAGTVSITGATATLRNTLATDLGESSLTRNLTVNSGGGVTQSGALLVGVTAVFSAPSSDIDLSADGNDFRYVTLSGVNVWLNDVNALTLGRSTVSGTLDVTVDGAITQSGALTVGGAATLTTAETANITLSNSGNDFSSVGIVAANNVVLRDKNALELAESTVSGSLTVTTKGDITQSGALLVADKTTLTAGSSYHITLTEANDFEELAVVSARNVELTDTSELLLAKSRIYGTFTVAAGGSVTQSGAVTVSGLSTFTLAFDDLILNQASNNFSMVTLDVPGNVWLRDTNALVLGDVNVGGDLMLQANLNSSSRTAIYQSGGALVVGGSTALAAGSASTITLNNASNVLHGSDPDDAVSVASAYATLRNSVATNLGASSVSRNLTITSADSITQSGPVFVGRIARLSAAVDIILTDADNDFGMVMASADNVTLNDLNALILGISTVANALDVTTDGPITQSGALEVDGATTLNAGLDNNISLTYSGNQFSSVGVVSGKNVALRDADNLELAESTISGTLAVTTDGTITQGGALEVAEKTTLTAGATNNITLNDPANNFSEISIVSGLMVSIENAESLVLGSSKVDMLRVVLHGLDSGLSQSGAVVVAYGALLDAALGGIELLNTGNIFPVLALVSDGDVSLRTMSAIELDGVDVSGDLNLTAGGAIAQLVGSPIVVGGTATLATNASASIALDDTANSIAEVAVTSANDVTIVNTTALVLGASNISGDLDVTTNGDLTQSGALAVAGTLTIDAGGNNVDLSTEMDNDFGTVNLTGQDVALQTTNSIVLAAAAVGGNLAIQAAGSITDDGTVTVTGDTTLTAGTDIELDEAASAYMGVLSLQGQNIDVFNTVATMLGDCTATGNLTISSADTLTNSGTPNGVLIVGGDTSLIATNELELYLADCVFGGSTYFQGNPLNLY